MKKGLLIITAIFGLSTLPLTGSAVPVRYDLGNHSIGSWSGSAWHTADRCRQGDLFMCGSQSGPLTGHILGHWDGTSLHVTGGALNGHSIHGGLLGGAYSYWTLSVAHWGRFYFDTSLSINRITDQYLTLWGQNRAAYYCGRYGRKCDKGKGLDIYATPTKVPEPGALGLLGAGLLGIAFARRRRQVC